MSRRKQITVIGGGGRVPDDVDQIAERVGELIAERGAVLICGGRGGVMEAACRGAKRKGGLTIGILPDGIEGANPYVDITIVTEMGDARNVINVKSADAVIAIHGEAGTLSEIALALKAGKKVIGIRTSGGVSAKLAGETIGEQRVLSADSAEGAVDLALQK